jgi:AraC family transcriptional regulator of adaptative response / DNA-3-methyladenine glycosylase II
VVEDEERCYRAAKAKDRRFDGWFFAGVTSTGIYCRPSCPAMTPKRANLRFFATAAGAQLAGFRACKRCRPDATPGSPAWNGRADVAARAMRLIADGVVDREGVGGLARRLGYSHRQVHRQLVAEVGAGPLALARAQRAQTARTLIETTDLAFADVAFASGFASVRQFNDTVQAVFATTPTGLRARRRGAPAGAGWVQLRLPYREPMDADAVLGFLAARLVPGVEELTDGTYRRTLDLPHGPAIVELRAQPGAMACRLRLTDLRDLTTAVQRSRRLFDLDADPEAVVAQLGADPALGPLVATSPGRRSPGAVDGHEVAVRAVLGQQISVAAARTLAGRLVAEHGAALPRPDGGLTHLFPRWAALADADLPLPAARAGALRSLVTSGIDVEPGADRPEVERRLLALPGIGPWTAGSIALRALGDPDVFLPTDGVVRVALATLGCQPADAERWRPWRSYALHHLWGSCS